MTTEREWVMENASEYIHLAFDSETGEQSHLVIMDGDFPVLGDIDKNFALALAARLVELAIELPETKVHLPVGTLPEDRRVTPRRLTALPDTGRPLRRHPDVDDHLRSIDD